MSYEIEVTRRAEKEILKLDAAMFARMRAAIDGLSDNPRPLGARKLRGRENEWRMRVGRFRVLYTIKDATRRISTALSTGRMCIVADARVVSVGFFLLFTPSAPDYVSPHRLPISRTLSSEIIAA